MAERTKKQHVVPRFHLNKFSDPDGIVWTYSGDAQTRAAKPEATAVEKNFYRPVGAEIKASITHRTAQFITANKEAYEQSDDRYEEKTGHKISLEDREKMRRFMSDPSNFSINVLRSAGLPMLGGKDKLANIFLKYEMGCWS